MVKEIDPKDTSREKAFEFWKHSPTPMVTISRTLDVSHLLSISRKHKYRFNMLMCWCISRAASMMEQFYIFPARESLIFSDSLAVSTVVKTLDGSLCNCDIPLCYSIDLFNREYMMLTRHVQNTCKPYDISDSYAVIDTKPFVEHEIDSFEGAYSAADSRPGLVWGKYRKHFFKTTLPVSFRFHHAQMDELHAMMFLDLLQKEIDKASKPPLPSSEPVTPPAPSAAPSYPTIPASDPAAGLIEPIAE
ncbi:MAG: chloramphenicol acetyltransferase [Oscillospiraceae bacterium]|nr:chloramphenicol acetyltransferase [Oscillospiraceae bacterium]